MRSTGVFCSGVCGAKGVHRWFPSAAEQFGFGQNATLICDAPQATPCCMRGELARSMSAVLLLCHPLEADCLINNPNLFRGGPPCSIPRSLHARPGRHVLARTSVRPRTEGRRGRKCAGKAVQVPRTCSHALARLFTSCEGEWPRDFEARWVSHALPRAPMALHGTPSSHQQPPSVWQRAGESEQVLSQSRPHRLSSFQHQRRWTNRCQVS